MLQRYPSAAEEITNIFGNFIQNMQEDREAAVFSGVDCSDVVDMIRMQRRARLTCRSDSEADAETEAEEPAQPSSGGRRKALKAVLIVLGTCVAVAGLLLAVFLILADVAPDFIDSILYTPEELRIINY